MHGLYHWFTKAARHHRHKKMKKEFNVFVDHFIYFIALFSPLMTIPQVLKIWLEQNASGVSITSWGAYVFTTSFWLAYGIFHKDKPIIISNILWLVLEILIVIGVVIYG